MSLAPYPHDLQKVLRSTSGNVQSNGLETITSYPKVEDVDGTTVPGHPPYTTASALRRRAVLGQRHRRQKRTRADDDTLLPFTELQNAKYRAYRARPRRDQAKDGKDVWSDELEEAFQSALRAIPPMGRRKTPLKGKPSGRNELIAHHIMGLTGVYRDRKQISSHIQVLKQFMSKEDPWMKLVTPDDEVSKSDVATKTNFYYDDSALQLVVTNSNNLAGHGSLHIEHHVFPDIKLGQTSKFHPNYQAQSPSIQRIEFEMWMQPPAQNKPSHKDYHIYTRIQSETGAQSRNLEDIRDWRTSYPRLTEIHQQCGLNTQIILLETSFELMTDRPLRGSVLPIHFFADVLSETRYTDWQHMMHIYEGGVHRKTCKAFLNDTELNHAKTRVEIPLGSEWWVTVFLRITNRRLDTIANGNAQAVRQEEENARRYLHEMTIMQEIYATPQDGRFQTPQRVAILLWKFRQTRPGEAATTTWRNLHAPPNREAANSPAPSMIEAPMTLDSNLHANIPPHQHQQQTIYADYFAQNPHLFADASDDFTAECASEQTLDSQTPVAQTHYPSFASSCTSTSTATLPSNAPPCDSGYGSCTTTSMTSSHNFHQSQSQPQPLHPSVTEHDVNDFSGGHIQLDFDPETDPQPSTGTYDATGFLAPPVEMQPGDYCPTQQLQFHDQLAQQQAPQPHEYQHQRQQHQQYESNAWQAAFPPEVFEDVRRFQQAMFGDMGDVPKHYDSGQTQGQEQGQVLGEVRDLQDGGREILFQ